MGNKSDFIFVSFLYVAGAWFLAPVTECQYLDLYPISRPRKSILFFYFTNLQTITFTLLASVDPDKDSFHTEQV